MSVSTTYPLLIPPRTIKGVFVSQTTRVLSIFQLFSMPPQFHIHPPHPTSYKRLHHQHFAISMKKSADSYGSRLRRCDHRSRRTYRNGCRGGRTVHCRTPICF